MIHLQDHPPFWLQREEERLWAQQGLGDIRAKEDASLSLNLMEPGCILQMQTARAREAGRDTAEHGQQARAALGHTSQPGLAADSTDGVGLPQTGSQVMSKTIVAAPGKFLYMLGESFACACFGSLS